MNVSLMFLLSGNFIIRKRTILSFVNVSDGGDNMKSVIYLGCV